MLVYETIDYIIEKIYEHNKTKPICSKLSFKRLLLNPFVPNAPFLYPLKTSENCKVIWCFHEVEKECIGNRWVKLAAECKFALSSKIDGCTMDGPFSGTFKDMYMINTSQFGVAYLYLLKTSENLQGFWCFQVV